MSDLQSIDSNPPGSSVHEILQARILEWVAISISREDVSFTKCSSMFVFCATAWVAFLLKLFSCLVAVFYALNSIKTDLGNPGSPVVRTSQFHCKGLRFHPWLGS